MFALKFQVAVVAYCAAIVPNAVPVSEVSEAVFIGFRQGVVREQDNLGRALDLFGFFVSLAPFGLKRRSGDTCSHVLQHFLVLVGRWGEGEF